MLLAEIRKTINSRVGVKTKESMTSPVQNQAKDEQPKSADTSAENFEKLRRKFEGAEREKNAALAKAAAYEKEITEMAKRKVRDVEPVEDDNYDEPYVDEKRLNRKLEKFEERFSKKVDEVADQKARSMIEQERNAQFLKQNPDFSQVLSPEVIEKFANKHPEMAEPMLEMPDGFARQKLLYQAIKVSGVHKNAPPPPSIQETIEKNRRGAFYQPTGVGAAPYAGAGDFSETGQKTAYQKIQELKSRLRL